MKTAREIKAKKCPDCGCTEVRVWERRIFRGKAHEILTFECGRVLRTSKRRLEFFEKCTQSESAKKQVAESNAFVRSVIKAVKEIPGHKNLKEMVVLRLKRMLHTKARRVEVVPVWIRRSAADLARNRARRRRHLRMARKPIG